MLVLKMAAGREEPILWPPITMLPSEEEPQLFSIKVVPSPSVIVSWSLRQVVPPYSMSNAVNFNDRI